MLMPRDVFDALQAEHRAEIAYLREANATLLDKYHALRLQGATVPEPIQALERPVVDPVKVAIQKAAGRDRGLMTIMSRAASAAKSRGDSDEDIIAAIEHGVEDDEGIPA